MLMLAPEREEVGSAADLKTWAARELIRLWERKRSGRAMPARADFDPVDFGRLLPGIMLVDVLRNPLRFRYRLIGTAIAAIFGRDATGRMVGVDLYGDQAGPIFDHYRYVAEARSPHAVNGRMGWSPRHWMHFEWLLLPMGPDGTVVDMILATLVRTSGEPATEEGEANRFRVPEVRPRAEASLRG